MEKHHRESINKFLELYKKDNSVLAIILGGSIAHGYAKTDADIDVCMVVDSEEFQKRKAANNLAFALWDICTYDNGYIDCKVADLDFLIKASESGSDPARYAFKDCEILYSGIDNLTGILSKITAFPKEKVDERRKRFASQLLAWKWYFGEGTKKQNKYLLFLSIQKLVLFSSRIILNENEMLYPFHKWMLEEVKKAERKPDNFIEDIEELFANHTIERVSQFCGKILDYIGFSEQEVNWANYFLKDSEQNWIGHEAPVDDL